MAKVTSNDSLRLVYTFKHFKSIVLKNIFGVDGVKVLGLIIVLKNTLNTKYIF